MLRRVIIGVVAMLVAGCIAAVVVFAYYKERTPPKVLAMTRLGEAFKKYARQSQEGFFPPKCLGKNVFLPDMAELCRVCPEVANDEGIQDLLSAKDGTPVCYLGHIVINRDMLNILLKNYAEKDAESVRFADISTGMDSPEWCKKIWRIGDRGLAYLAAVSGYGPCNCPMFESRIPILWEMSLSGNDIVNVLFMYGNVQRCHLPKDIPFSKGMMHDLQKAMSLPVDPDAEADLKDSPISEPVQALLHTARRYNGPLGDITLVYCDQAPSVHLEGVEGYRLDLGDDGNVVLFPDTGKTFPVITPKELFESIQGYPVYFGVGAGVRWYANFPQYGTCFALNIVWHKLQLSGGDDEYAFTARRFGHDPGFSYRGDHDLRQTLRFPKDLWTYANAYFLLRAQEGTPVSKELLEAIGILRWKPNFESIHPDRESRWASTAVYAEAEHRFVNTDDVEAAICAVLMDHWQDPSYSHGLLHHLPKDKAEAIISRIADSMPEPIMAEEVRNAWDPPKDRWIRK